MTVPDTPASEPYDWGWVIITARTDGVRYSVDRISDDIPGIFYDLTIPGDNITSGVLAEGETFALYVNQPWYPEVRIMASKDAYWGEYWFGQDNWRHFEPDVFRYVTGHDLTGEGRGCAPKTEEDLVNFLMDGTWAYMNEAGEVTTVLRFRDYRMADMESEEEYYTLVMDYDRLYAGEDEAPDLLVLRRDIYSDTDWSTLPGWFSSDSLGDYLISAVQLDGEQLLTLTQANNGDGALGYLLCGADENAREFTLHRYRGTAVFEGQG